MREFDILTNIINSTDKKNSENSSNTEGFHDINQSIYIKKNKELNSQQDINTNNNNNNNNNNINNNNNNNNNSNSNSKINNYLDVIISLIYLIFITVLIVYSIVLKNSNYLLMLLIITIFYIFYKIISQ